MFLFLAGNRSCKCHTLLVLFVYSDPWQQVPSKINHSSKLRTGLQFSTLLVTIFYTRAVFSLILCWGQIASGKWSKMCGALLCIKHSLLEGFMLYLSWCLSIFLSFKNMALASGHWVQSNVLGDAPRPRYVEWPLFLFLLFFKLLICPCKLWTKHIQIMQHTVLYNKCKHIQHRLDA